MKEGFYLYRNNVYYGCYDEEQVSGKGLILSCKPENIRINHPVSETDYFFRLWNNHRLLEPEYTDLQTMLLKMRSFININTEQIDFSIVEKKLNIPFPKELKLIYTAVYGQEKYFSAKEHFLPLDEIYIEQNIIVFFKKKRNPVAGYDTASGRLARYYKKEWYIDENDYCCYQFCIARMIAIEIENKPVFKKGRCKGKFVTTLNIEKELEQYCNEKYRLLSEFNAYGTAIIYSDDKLAAWIRSNGFYADIHIGAAKDEHTKIFAEHFGNIVWH